MNKKHKLKTESLNKEITELKDKLKFKSNYISEIKAELRAELESNITMGWNTGITTDIMQDYVNPEMDKLNDKIDINKNEKEHDELLGFIKGNIKLIGDDIYQIGDYFIQQDAVKIQAKPKCSEIKVIFNKRIAKRLFDMLDTMYKFKLEE